jgi:hypothetical protein
MNYDKIVSPVLIWHNGVRGADCASAFRSMMLIESDDIYGFGRADVVETPSVAEDHRVGATIGGAYVPSLLSRDVRVNAHIVITSGVVLGTSDVCGTTFGVTVIRNIVVSFAEISCIECCVITIGVTVFRIWIGGAGNQTGNVSVLWRD